MAAHNILLTSILRLLTPEEINELTTQSDGVNRFNLTDMLDQDLREGLVFEENEDGEGAKILPFKKEESEEEAQDKVVYFEAGEKVSEYMQHYFLKTTLGNTATDNSGNTLDTSVFILNEKKRFEYSQAKLKEKEIIGLYRKNASVDIEQEKSIKDDMSKSTKYGILVNKKQY